MKRIALVVGLLLVPAQTKAQQADKVSAVQQVAEAVCEKQIVLLGELPSHGEAHAFQAKAQIVEHLVKQCGFKALFFEAPIYDFLGFQDAIAEGHPQPQQLDRAIGGFWLTQELRAWRGWLFTQATEGNLLIGGLDDQVSATSDYARATLPDVIASALPSERVSECREAVIRNLYWRYNDDQPYDDAEQKRLQQCARQATDALSTQAESDVEPIKQRMTANLTNLYARQAEAVTAKNRDAMMYENVQWQRERMTEDSKVIIWTATVHGARQQGAIRHKPLGAWLAEQWGDGVAAIGFSAFMGVSSMAGMPSKPILEAPTGSLEARATTSETAWVYLDTAALKEMGIVSSRLLGRFQSADWSIYFDAVLVIREEVAPVFEPR